MNMSFLIIVFACEPVPQVVPNMLARIVQEFLHFFHLFKPSWVNRDF